MDIIALITLCTGTARDPVLSAPGSHVDVPDAIAQELIDRGFAQAIVDQEITSLDLHEAIMDAIADLKPEDFGRDKKPSVRALESALGRDITAADRDRAWVSYQQLFDDDEQ